MAILEPAETDIERRLLRVHEEKALREFRWSKRVGASSIGHECERKLWLDFRWAARELISGTTQRIFDRGNIEEDRIIADLKAAGLEVFHVDANGMQFEFIAADGHFVDKIDGVVKGLHESHLPHLLEIKSSNQKGFDRLLEKGCEKGKPDHYAQIQIGMHLAKLSRALYVVSNKNTEEIYTERLRYDAAYAISLEAKARRIVFSERAPAKVQPNFIGWPCNVKSKDGKRWPCKFLGMCHQKALPSEKNCRSCMHSTPIAGGKWHCEKRQIELPHELQVTGCELHLYHPDLMPFEAVDADDTSVTYRDDNGSELYNHLNGKIDNIPF